MTTEQAAPTADELHEIIADLLIELRWLAMFADVRSKDDSKVFARVNRGALRTIRDRAQTAVNKALAQ